MMRVGTWQGEAAKATMEAMTDMLAAAVMRKRVLEVELKAPGSGGLSSPETLVHNTLPLAQSEALEEQPADPCSWTPGPSDEGAATGLVAGGPERRSDCGIGEQGATMQKRNNSVAPQSREAEVSSPEQRLFNDASDSSRSIDGQQQTPRSESQHRISLEAWARARRDIKNKRQSGAFQVSPQRSASFQQQLVSDVANGGKQGSTDGGSLLHATERIFPPLLAQHTARCRARPNARRARGVTMISTTPSSCPSQKTMTFRAGCWTPQESVRHSSWRLVG